MLKSTFVHLKGFGKKKERMLWSNGIRTWDDFSAQWRESYSLLGLIEHHPQLRDSISALNAGDTSYFAERLPRQEHYRIAIEYPRDTLFLDIETTGLSHFYDEITLIGWSIDGQYGVLINGQDNKNDLFNAFARAKALVTFNGSLFDLRFLRKAFPHNLMPRVHVDLRFLAKRVGLSGGQKAIERMLGVLRPGIETKGETAPILWGEYRRGNLQALQELIRYNHADIEGMKVIFDECIKRLAISENIPCKPKISFSKTKSSIEWSTDSTDNSYRIRLHRYNGKPFPRITFKDLNRLTPLNGINIVGIDLVASESKESGFAILHGHEAVTCRVRTDKDIIKLICEHEAKLVSIDSPLSLPKGRTSVFDDDPMRSFGIMRFCERELKRRGINVYPSLITCMQKLTKRGIEIASKLRALGIPVIESYPGSAQDIMGIPRKQAGEQWLRLGLQDFGLSGPFLTSMVSHDELDAITSAVVGQFFLAGKFEALGTTDEDPLIIPDLNVNQKLWLERHIVGFSGHIGSGKTTAAIWMENNKGYRRVRYSDILSNILKKRGEQPTRSALQALGWEVHNGLGQRWLGKALVELAGDAAKIVVDGIRFPEDIAFLREIYGPGFVHCHVVCSQTIRSERTCERQLEDIPPSHVSCHRVELCVDKLREMADVIILNQEDMSAYHRKLDQI